MFGLLAYPAQGIYKSAKGHKRGKVRKAVEAGRKQSLGMTHDQQLQGRNEEVVRRFHELII